jgi:hypothetical protein
MSEISIYDIVPTPKLADKLIGTSVGGIIEDVTYNFTLQELLQLFIPNIPANTLQGVLDYGNTATQNINLTGTISTTNLSVLDTANILNSNFSGNTRIMAGLFDANNSIGDEGQVLISTGSSVEWYTIPTIIPTLQQVLQSGNTSDVSILLTADITANTATLSNVISNTSLSINGSLKDDTSSTGTSGQILSSTTSGVKWVDIPVYTAVSPLLYDNPTKTFSIQVANSSQSGYLTNTDWINFDGKQNTIALTTTGNSGSSTLVGSSLNIPTYTLAGLGGVPTSRTLTINNITYDLSANRSWTIATGGVASVSRGEERFVATAGQTTFILTNGYGIGYVDVYVNGVKYTSADFTASDGLTVVMNTGLVVNDIVDILTYQGAIVNATAPIVYNFSTGNISITQATTSVNGYLSSADWTTFNNKQSPITLTTIGTTGAATFAGNVLNIPLYSSGAVGTVTSVAALTLGTAGTDVSSTVANSTTTPVITLNLPTSSTVNRGLLSATDWTTFNAKQNALTLTISGFSGSASLVGDTLNVPTYTLSGLGGQPSSAKLTSLDALTYSSPAFVKMTGANTFALDTSTYLTSVAWGDIIGTVPTWNQNTTGNAATVTDGVYLNATQTLTNKTLTDAKLLNSIQLKTSAVGTYTPFVNTLASFVANVNDYQLLYVQNLSGGSDASADFVAYNDASDVNSYFIDMGISGSNYSSVAYPIFPANSGYVYTGGGTGAIPSDLYIGTGTVNSDIVLFVGGTEVSNKVVTIKADTQNVLIGQTIDTGEKLQVTGNVNITGDVNVTGATYSAANIGTDPHQLVTKEYVDNAVSAGLHIHQPVRLERGVNLTATYTQGGTTPTITAITTNDTLTSVGHNLLVDDMIVFNVSGNGIIAGDTYFVYEVLSANTFTISLTQTGPRINTLTNGTGLSLTSRANSGVGATLTNSGTQTALVIDGVPTIVADRILVYGQTNGYENGVYVVTNIGSSSTNWILTRASDADKYGSQNPNNLGGGDYFFVTSGNTGAGESYVVTNTGEIVFGTTAIVFTQFSAAPSYSGTDPINVSGQIISLTGIVDATHGGTGTATVTTGDLLYGSATNTWGKLPLGVAYKSLLVNASGTQVEWNAVALNQPAAVSGELSVTNGGTGGSTSSAARTNLGLAIGTDIPSLTGTGASGTWGISVTGNAGTATNGVVTTGSYADPTWITSLAYSKITGVPAFLTANQTITLSGAITGSGTTAITTSLASSVVGVSNLSATGTPSSTTFLRGDNTWATISGSGTVTTVSVVSANGFAGTVATATSTPAITISTSISGILKGNGTAISAASAGTDYQAPITLTTTGSSGASTFATNTLNIPTYTLSGLGGQASSTNLTSLSGLSYVSASFVKMTASGTFSLDTNTYYLASNPSGFTSNTGTVTSVAALTIATAGTDITSSVATGTTTPIITLNIPTASASNRGALSSADWTTFNGKQGALTLTTTGTSGAATLVGNTLNIPNYASGGSSGTVTSVSVVLANGFAGTVATDTTTPAITLSTTITGLLKGNGTSISAAVAGTDYLTSVGISNLTATGTPSSTTYLRGDNTWATISGGGSPAGTTGQIQYNNAGAFGGATRTKVDANGNINLALDTAPPTSATDTLTIYDSKIGGRNMIGMMDPTGLGNIIQTHVARNGVSWWSTAGNSTTIIATGNQALTATGTATAANIATTNIQTRMKRLEYLVTTAATTAIAGFRGPALQWWMGNAANSGGFHYICRFGPATGVATTTSRLFVGMSNVTTAPTDIEPSTQTNFFGVGYDAADATFQFMQNAAVTTTKTSLTGFTVPTVDRTSMYELAMFCAPNSTTLTYTFTDLNTGASISGTATANLPAVNTLLAPRGWCSAGGTSSVIGIALSSLYIETDY